MFFIKIVFTNKISSKLYQWGNTERIWEKQTQKKKNLLPLKTVCTKSYPKDRINGVTQER